MASRIDGAALGSVFAGSLLLYAGLTGKSVPAALQAVVQGKSPSTAPAKYGINPGVAVSGGSGGTVSIATDSQLANIALADQGHCYDFGGAPGTDGTGCWDCSSAVNWWAGKKAGLAIPGFAAGAYTGAEHGPSSFSWASWNGCVTIGTDPSAAQAGDICIWMNAIGHIGIAIGGGKMISALDPTDGTAVTPISGTASGVFLVRRIKAAA